MMRGGGWEVAAARGKYWKGEMPEGGRCGRCDRPNDC